MPAHRGAKGDETRCSAAAQAASVRVIIEGGHHFHPRRSPVFIEGGHPFSSKWSPQKAASMARAEIDPGV
jgi:hypothetical protein